MGVNGNLTPELAEQILNLLSLVDEGNTTIMTDSFTRFVQTFPEHTKIASKIFLRETARPFRVYEEKESGH